jgi:cold shock CspA family protein
MAQSWNKREREKKKQKEKQDKAEKMRERKENASKGNAGDMMAYVDEDGNISSTPPDPRKKKEIKLEDIQIGVPEQSDREDPLRTGIVSFFNTDKGFGFIRDMQSQESVFFHINQTLEPIAENNKVSFEVQKGPKGPMAVSVKKI